ncbi:MAG TPA: hypothetical protein VFP30_05105 [Candidatus Limnocylindria bacterium]|nr:hypothetical protein [Candidatus Limnocylindria bacterium]
MDAEHDAQEFVRQGNVRPVHPVQRLQQPSRRALLQLVQPVADCRLRRLGKLSLGIPPHDIRESGAADESTAERIGRNHHRVSRHLRDHLERPRIAGQEHWHAGRPLAPDGGRFDHGALAAEAHQGDRTAQREVHALHRLSRSVEDLARHQRLEAAVLCQRVELIGIESDEQAIPGIAG